MYPLEPQLIVPPVVAPPSLLVPEMFADAAKAGVASPSTPIAAATNPPEMMVTRLCLKCMRQHCAFESAVSMVILSDTAAGHVFAPLGQVAGVSRGPLRYASARSPTLSVQKKSPWSANQCSSSHIPSAQGCGIVLSAVEERCDAACVPGVAPGEWGDPGRVFEIGEADGEVAECCHDGGAGAGADA